MQLKDAVGSPEVVLKTARLSCMYPIMEVADLSKNVTDNPPNAAVDVVVPFTTQDELMAGKERSVYQANVWIRVGLNFTFRVEITSGSHLEANWTDNYQLTSAQTCGSMAGASPAPITGITLDTTADLPCSLPFRLVKDGPIYYGCTGNELG